MYRHILLCKVKMQYLLTCKVNRYFLLALHGSIDEDILTKQLYNKHDL